MFKNVQRISRTVLPVAKTKVAGSEALFVFQRQGLIYAVNRRMTTTSLPSLTALQPKLEHSESYVYSNGPVDDGRVDFKPSDPALEEDQSQKQPDEGKSKLPTQEQLEHVATTLQKDLTEIFIVQPDYSIYDRDIVLEDRIWGRTVVGGLDYIKLMATARIMAHLRFVLVFFKITSLTIDSEYGAVVVKWRVLGMTMWKMALNYIPKKLYRSDNMMREIPVWKEGISTYFVNTDGRVIKHILDNKEEDKDRQLVGTNSTMDKLKEKIANIRPKEASPVMCKKSEEEK